MAEKTPRIGQLDRRIEIQEPTETRTATGGVDTAWAAVARCWAGVEYPLTGNGEDVQGDQSVATTRVVFCIRYRDGLTEKMRIVYKGDNYDLLPPFQEIGRKQYMKIPAQKQI